MKKPRDGLTKHLVQVFIAVSLLFAVKELLLYFHATSSVSRSIMVVMWCVLVIASLLFLRKWMLVFRKQRDQEVPPFYEASLPISENRNQKSHSEQITGDFRGFYWQLYVTIPGEDTFEAHQRKWKSRQDIGLQHIDGPYCPQDNGKIKQEKTLFGHYRFRCAYCSYKQKQPKSITAIMQDLQNMFYTEPPQSTQNSQLDKFKRG